MKKNLIKLSSKGFSLVELMVVVAIIGILATIAVPQIQKFIAKSRQAEARSALGTYYTAQKTFFSEYSVYYPGFGQIGYTPAGTLNYNVGSATAVVTTTLDNVGYTGSSANTAVQTRGLCGTSGTVANGCLLSIRAGANVTGGVTTNTTFVGSAWGTVDNDATDWDNWRIDEAQTLTNPTADVD